MQPAELKLIFDAWFGSFFLIFCRILGFTTSAPVLSSSHVPVLVRISFVFLFSVLSKTFVRDTNLDFTQYNFFFCLVLNLVFGWFIGFVANLVISIVEVAGEVVDNQAGLNSAVIMGDNRQETLIKKALVNFGTMVFLYYGGFQISLYSVKLSFAIFPLKATDFSLIGMNLLDVIELTKDVLVLGVTTASPVLVTIIFQDIILGLISRATQQKINAFQLSFSLKPLVGILILMFTLPLINTKLIKVYERGSNVFGLGDQKQNPYESLQSLKAFNSFDIKRKPFSYSPKREKREY